MEDILRFADLAKKRQSDRKYKEQPVEKEKILQCLETARLSPLQLKQLANIKSLFNL